MKTKEFSKNLHAIVDGVKHEPCVDCIHYKLGYSFADGFQCEKAKVSYDNYPKMWVAGVCLHDERLKNYKKRSIKGNLE